MKKKCKILKIKLKKHRITCFVRCSKTCSIIIVSDQLLLCLKLEQRKISWKFSCSPIYVHLFLQNTSKINDNIQIHTQYSKQCSDERQFWRNKISHQYNFSTLSLSLMPLPIVLLTLSSLIWTVPYQNLP